MRCAVIPTYNEALSVGSVVLTVRDYVNTVYVVDDGSDDDTANIAERAGAVVLRHEENKGKGAALRTGLERALEDGADVCVLLDGDGQHTPSRTPALVDPIELDEADLVIGVRDQAGIGDSSSVRRAGRRTLDFVTNSFTENTYADTQSGFRAIRAAVIPKILNDETGFGVESSMLLQAERYGLRIQEVSITENYPEGSDPARNPAVQGLQVIVALLRHLRNQHPLFVFGGVGLLLLLLGIWFGFRTTQHYYLTRNFWPGKAMLSMLCTIVGIQLFTVSLMLDYLSGQNT